MQSVKSFLKSFPFFQNWKFREQMKTEIDKFHFEGRSRNDAWFVTLYYRGRISAMSHEKRNYIVTTGYYYTCTSTSIIISYTY